MPKKELVKRYILFIVSLFISALGIALAKKGSLGLSPVSSVSNILSLKFTGLSFGIWLFIWNCVLILGQVVIKRKKFQLIELLQIPLSFLFGYFTDLGMMIFSFWRDDTYLWQISAVIAGTAVLGLGIALSVIADVVMNSGEAFVRDLSGAVHKEFGNIKIAFDIGCVIISIILSLIFFGEIRDTREGTVIAAVCTGLAVKFFTRILKKPVEKIIADKKTEK